MSKDDLTKDARATTALAGSFQGTDAGLMSRSVPRAVGKAHEDDTRFPGLRHAPSGGSPSRSLRDQKAATVVAATPATPGGPLAMTRHAAKPAVSPRRLTANRANAQRSTGPRTEAGKRVSSQNARKAPPCPFTFHLPEHFAAQWFHDALRRTAACSDVRARLLLINRCMLQAHEIRWSALERTLFDVALTESNGCVEDASLWLAQQVAAARGLITYHRWITTSINQVERSLAALAAQSADIEAEAPKTMAAGAGGGATFDQLSPSDLGPDSTLPINYNDGGWSYGGLSGLYLGRVGAPQPPRTPQPPKPPTIGPIRGRYRLYLRCPAAPEPPNEPNAQCESVPQSSGIHHPAAPERPELHQPEQRPNQGALLQQPDLRLEPANRLQHLELCPQHDDQLQQLEQLPGPPNRLQHQELCPQHDDQLHQPEQRPEPPDRLQQPQLSPQHDDQLHQTEQRPGPPIRLQQPQLSPQHSPGHCPGPAAATTTPDPNASDPQPNLPEIAIPASQPARTARNQTQAASSSEPIHGQATQPNEPIHQSGPPPSESAHSPPPTSA